MQISSLKGEQDLVVGSPDRYLRTEGGFMNLILRIVVGGLTGWLTGKAVEVEGRITVVKESHVIDAFYGIIGALSDSIGLRAAIRTQGAVLIESPERQL